MRPTRILVRSVQAATLPSCRAFFCALLLASGPVVRSSAAELVAIAPQDVLPATTALYVEADDPATALALTEHLLVGHAYLRPLYEMLPERGIHLAYDPAAGAVFLFFQEDSARQANEPPTLASTWQVVSIPPGAAEQLVQSGEAIDFAEQRLVLNEDFAWSWGELPEQRSLAVFVRPDELPLADTRARQQRLREAADLFGQLTAGRLQVAGALIEPLVGLLVTSDYAALAVTPGESDPEVTVALPAAPREATLAWRLAAELPNDGEIFRPLLPESTIVSLSTYLNRDLAELWGELLAGTNRDQQATDARNLTQLFTTGLLATLGASDQIHPRLQVILARQAFSAADPQPDMVLPATAVVFQPRDPRRQKPVFTLAFFSAMREANEALAREGLPRLVLKSRQEAGGLIASAVFPPRAADGTRRTEHNFSPTIAFIDDRFIFSTTDQLAVELVTLASAQGGPQTMPGPVRIDVGPTASLRLGLDNLPVGVDQLSERLPDWLPRSTLVRKVTDRGIVFAQDAADHLPEGTVRVPVWRPHWNLNLKLRQ